MIYWLIFPFPGRTLPRTRRSPTHCSGDFPRSPPKIRVLPAVTVTSTRFYLFATFIYLRWALIGPFILPPAVFVSAGDCSPLRTYRPPRSCVNYKLPAAVLCYLPALPFVLHCALFSVADHHRRGGDILSLPLFRSLPCRCFII